MNNIVYYDPRVHANDGKYRTGEIWLVDANPDSPAGENYGVMKLPQEIYQGLFALGIIDQLQDVPNNGMIGEYEEGILFPDSLHAAIDIINRAIQSLTGGVLDVHCVTQVKPEEIEYRMKITENDLKSGLSQLVSFIAEGAKSGHAVQLWL